MSCIGILAVGVIVLLPVKAVQVGSLDYFVSIRRMPWAGARADCEKRGGTLAYVTNETIQNAVAAEMAKTGRDEAWIGGKTTRVDWHWTDGTVIAPQGCWQDTVTGADMPNSRGVASATPSDCISACEDYQYVGIKKSKECVCSNSYGSLGPSHSCHTPCTETDDGDCGGSLSNSVFYVKGSWAGWNIGNPRTDTGTLTCATADLLGYYKYSSVSCNETWHYMCHLHTSTCGVNGSRYFFKLGNKCVRLSMQMKDWFEARATCFSQGGDLLKIESEAEHKELLQKMKEVRFGMKYFIGLTEMVAEWIESTGSTDLIYTNWGTAGIHSNGSKCIHISGAAGYTWTNADCLKKKYYICQLKSLSPIAQTTPSWLKRVGAITEDPSTLLHPPNDFDPYENWMKGHASTVPPGGKAPMSGSIIAVVVILSLITVGALLFGVYTYAKGQGTTPFKLFDKDKQDTPELVFSGDTETHGQADYGTVYSGEPKET